MRFLVKAEIQRKSGNVEYSLENCMFTRLIETISYSLCNFVDLVQLPRTN